MVRMLSMIGAMVAALVVMSASAGAQTCVTFDCSPYNFRNSESNFQNSPYNFRNSPNNFDNSPYNTNSRNGVYDNDGNRAGYAVRRPDGGVNVFDNSGNRTGYVPGRQ